jgi:hypothetical protein
MVVEPDCAYRDDTDSPARELRYQIPQRVRQGNDRFMRINVRRFDLEQQQHDGKHSITRFYPSLD